MNSIQRQLKYNHLLIKTKFKIIIRIGRSLLGIPELTEGYIKFYFHFISIAMFLYYVKLAPLSFKINFLDSPDRKLFFSFSVFRHFVYQLHRYVYTLNNIYNWLYHIDIHCKYWIT